MFKISFIHCSNVLTHKMPEHCLVSTDIVECILASTRHGIAEGKTDLVIFYNYPIESKFNQHSGHSTLSLIYEEFKDRFNLYVDFEEHIITLVPLVGAIRDRTTSEIERYPVGLTITD